MTLYDTATAGTRQVIDDTGMDFGLQKCLEQIPNDSFSQFLPVFTDGRSPIDRREIESLNIHKAGIAPLGIGDDLDRPRLEMTAA